MMVGIYGLLFEFSNPGFVVPGVVGAICLLLGLFALQMLPVNFAGLALILLGDRHCSWPKPFCPASASLGLGGIAAFVIGAVMLFDSETPGFGIPLLLIGRAGRDLRGVRPCRRGHGGQGPPAPGGQRRLDADRHDRPVDRIRGGTGWALVEGEHWKVHGSGPLEPGARVRVVRVLGRTLEVAAAADAPMKGA